MLDEQLTINYWILDGSTVMPRPRRIALKANATVVDLLHQLADTYGLSIPAVDIWKV